MKKINSICALISLCVMVGLPGLAVTFVKGDGGMAVCFLLFFAVNPILSVCNGVFAGKNWKASWFQPLLCAVLFLAGIWLFFDPGEIAFLAYAACYAALGYVAAGLVQIAILMKQKNKP